MGAEAKGYEVMVKSMETIAAVLPVQEHRLVQSNFDLLLPPIDVGVFFCFRKPAPVADTNVASVGPITFPAIVANLKAALAKVLVTYYPLAGEVVTNSAGEPEILCNNRGVDLTEAYADVDLRDLNLYDPDDSVEAKLVPKKKDGILSIQVTELRCGAVVVGCMFDHRVADAYSFNMFMSAWAETTLGQPISSMPSFRRSLLASRPLLPSKSLDPLLDQFFTPLSLCPPPNPLISFSAPVNRIYYVPAADVARLQEIAGRKHSKLVCFTAYLWQILARSADLGEKSCSMGIVVDGRTRMKNVHGEQFMENYFGNVLSIPFGNLRVESLLDMKLAEVAQEVYEWLSPAATEDHFLGILDWVEAHRPEPAAARIYLGDTDEEDKSVSCVVSSGRGFPEINFGWGNAAFGSYHFPWGGKAGYLMPIPQKTGDWVVYAHVAPSIVSAMEEEPTIFRQLTTEYFLGSV
ncbi:hypothetical protein LUZ62_073815 [Rhynchospora pubera]|uniref:Uncharacterized protein n=1 Tax=Rhynchospora pubera TaxID=906938 RepID=A0AAV8D9T4_9POAL|nr:hypothetical protein LUZ62_073815 [Rhynchospora pubera]